MPIITCSGKRNAKVAKELTDKGYCSTKSLYYYGVKLHALAFRRLDKIPFPEEIQITPKERLDAIIKLLPYVIPKNSHIEIDSPAHHFQQMNLTIIEQTLRLEEHG
ncbi:hypothetical protein EKM05_14025 [Flavobacterium sp. GSP27]|nr:MULTISPECIES: hypothetical protein [unclassified Flavobacterium]RTY80876.1 hypothetical protein EKL99_14280 [Flavobacterium sp. ZB4P23]RTY87048.1 hypothetical protein EKL32_26905 [Flavobacterium sp. GSN2]RTZ04966.1 hypothetical protein EKM05_14025 [Flavobacterium sp. GSP27]